jgi:hypothetical protein
VSDGAAKAVASAEDLASSTNIADYVRLNGFQVEIDCRFRYWYLEVWPKVLDVFCGPQENKSAPEMGSLPERAVPMRRTYPIMAERVLFGVWQIDN